MALNSGVLFLLLSAFSLSAQDRGTITGVITDAAGAAVPGAAIKVANPATGLLQSTTSGPDGTYTAPYLPVGTYTVTAEKPGFRTAQAVNIPVQVNSTARIDLSLEVGQLVEMVEVNAAAPLVQTERTDLGKVFGAQTIQDLPLTLSGGLRNNLSFVLLTPGVTVTPGQDLSLRIGGGLSSEQSMLLDGAEAASERRNDPSFQSVSTDAIAEFKVITNSYSAEYGRTGNGIINFTTKSGTNQLHGSLFEFFRNDKLNARGFYPPRRSVVRQNNFGGTAGGPVYVPKVYDGRNKAFFFFSYENAIFRQGNPGGLVSVPTEAMRAGDFSVWRDGAGAVIPVYDPTSTRVDGSRIVRDPFPGNLIPRARIVPAATTLNKYLPATELPGIFNNINVVGNPGSDQNVWSIKGDYAFSDKSRINGLFSRQFFGRPDAIGPIPGPLGENFNSQGINKFYRVNHDYVITPTLLNHFTFGMNKRDVIEYFSERYYDIPEADRKIIELGGATATSQTGNRRPPSLYTLGDGYVRLGFWIDTLSPSKTWTINEQVAWIKGSHNLKFGFNFIRQDYRRIDCNTCMGEANFSRGTTGLPGAPGQTGASYAAFLLGMADNGRYNFSGDFNYGQPYYAWYLQDDYKVTRKLTLNIGLRYELPFPKAERDGKQSNLCRHCSNPAAGGILGALEFAGNGVGRTGRARFTDVRMNAFSPRLGLAYQIAPKTVVRAGGALYYLPMREGANADRGTDGFGGFFNLASPDGGVSPGFLYGDGFPASPRKPPIIDPGLNLFGTVGYMPRYAGRAPYLYDWNFTVEQGLGQSTVVRASYQATMGVKLLAGRELINQVDPSNLRLRDLLFVPISSDAARQANIASPWAGFPGNRSVNQALRPLPQYTGISQSVDGDTSGHSTYHALTMSAERRYSNGLFFLTSYTFSKLISNTQGGNPGLGGFLGAGDVGTQNGYDRRADKAISNQDVPHHLVVSYSYELPVGRGKKYLNGTGRAANLALGGWKLSGVQNYQSGYPMRVVSNQNTGLFSGTVRANLVGGQPLKNPAYQGDPNAAPYINPAAFTRPDNFTFGNSGANLPGLRNPALLSEDFTFGKDFFFGEARRVEFKSSFFNAFNRTLFGGVSGTSPGILNLVENPSFGRILQQSNRPREVQFSLRLVF